MTGGKGRRPARRAPAREATLVAERAQPPPRPSDAPPWYVAEGERGQQLLEQGRIGEAAEIFQTLLKGFGETPSYGEAVILGRLGRCLHLSGQPLSSVSRFREALEVTERLTPTDGVRDLRGVLRCELGDVLRALGRHDEARTAYLDALNTAEQLQDTRAQVVDLGQLGALEIDEGRLDEAMRRYRTALQLLQRLSEPPLEAAIRSQIARIHRQSGDWDKAERQYRTAIELERKSGAAAGLVRNLSGLADLLQDRPEGLAEARALTEEALASAQANDPIGAAAWRLYGLLADIVEREAAAIPDHVAKAALEAQARDYRELQQRAPLIARALVSLPDEPTLGRAVLLGQLGRCLHLGGRADLGVDLIGVGLDSLRQVTPTATVTGLRGMLLSELGNLLCAVDRQTEAQQAYQASLEVAEELQDLRGLAVGHVELGALAVAQGRPEDGRDHYDKAMRLLEALDDPDLEAAIGLPLQTLFERRPGEVERPSDTRQHGDSEDAAPPEVTLRDDVAIDYGFEPDLLVNGRRESRLIRSADEPEPLAPDLRPVVMPGTRSWTDDDGAIRFRLPASEPSVEADPGCVVLRQTRRDVDVRGKPRLVWRLVKAMDGTATVGEILGALAASDQQPGGQMLAALTEAGAIDVSGRPTARYVHQATKKGVLPAGGLGGDEALQLTADTAYRAYPNAPRLPLRETVPQRLQAFHGLTRSRRSRRGYTGLAITREEFEALLHTACGVTGAIDWQGRTLKLRAYPSSGGLYAVEIYPVVFHVIGLEPAVYHYRANDQALETVRPSIDQRSFVRAALPMERQMVAGTAAMLCLTGFFPRHERKYGEGGYRMLVAEAGHISQNLILAATALGLNARPFGGVFDQLLSRELGVDEAEEAFLLAVLLGHAEATLGGSQQTQQ